MTVEINLLDMLRQIKHEMDDGKKPATTADFSKATNPPPEEPGNPFTGNPPPFAASVKRKKP